MCFFLDGKEINDLLTTLINKFDNIASFIKTARQLNIPVAFTSDYAFFNSIDVAYIDNAVFEDTYNKLSKNQFEVSSFNDTEIKGMAKANNDRDVLFTTIPYSSNWKAYVDGAETETYAACNDSFVAVKLSSGEHSIEFKYKDSNVIVGLIMSAAGIVILAGMIVFSRKKQVNPI